MVSNYMFQFLSGLIFFFFNFLEEFYFKILKNVQIINRMWRNSSIADRSTAVSILALCLKTRCTYDIEMFLKSTNQPETMLIIPCANNDSFLLRGKSQIVYSSMWIVHTFSLFI